MLRNVGSVLVGLLVGAILNMLLIGLNVVLHPAPEGADLADPAQMSAYLSTLPVTGFLGAIAAHMAQAFGGGWLAARLGTAPLPNALVIGVLTAAGAAYNIVDLGAPLWMWVEVPLLVVASALAAQLGARR